MLTSRIRFTFSALAICLILIAVGGSQAGAADLTMDMRMMWGDTYTGEEIAAIERALWAANLTLDDLKFRKDYTKGYECFQWVREMMADPLSIAPGMDKMVGWITNSRELVSPHRELNMTASYIGWGLPARPYYKPPGWAIDSAEFTPDEFSVLNYLTRIADSNLDLQFTDEELNIIRQNAPLALSWHDVFESPFTEEQVKQWDEFLEGQPDDYLYQLMSKLHIDVMTSRYIVYLPDPRNWLVDLPTELFPAENPIIVNSDAGLIGIGTYGDDTWEGDFAALIDPGGNDHYINCRIGAAYGTEGKRIGYFADLGGDDFYDCGDTNITLGAAVLGVAAFYDLGQGNDRYIGGSCTMGAAMCGIATFYDDGGSDTYEGKVYTQGAAGFGIGIMVDDSVQDAPVVPTDEETPDPIDIRLFDNDRYHAWVNSQAFARTKGFAICSNKRGNEIYEAGGVYLDAPLFTDRYQSFSQGFAIGERGIDYAGGIALIVDYNGNDRYLGDVYNQGVGYWYSAGLLYDGGGNDTYEMTQYGQGSGIHLAIGGLIDVAGSDTYIMHSGLGVAGSHDFAASVLHDRGGNDRYFGNTSCNGGSLTNSAVIFIDREGNDTYAGRRSGGINFGRPERGFCSIGILVDLQGNDDYLGIMDNDTLWNHTDIGVGWDTSPAPLPEEEQQVQAPGETEPEIEYPEIIDYEGELNQETFDELWDIATRWRVGENRWIVPKAVDRLIAFGPEVLPYISAEFDDMRSGLAMYAFNPILKAFYDDNPEPVLDVLRENLSNGDEMRIRIALAIVSEQKWVDVEDYVVDILNEGDAEMARRAIGTLGAIGSHAADEILLANLDPSVEEALIKVSMDTLMDLDVYCYEQLRGLLDYPTITVREALVNKLAAKFDVYGDDIKADLFSCIAPTPENTAAPMLNTRSFRSVLRILQKAAFIPSQEMLDAISQILDGNIVLTDVDTGQFSADDTGWGIRADAVKLVRRWQEIAAGRLDVELWELRKRLHDIVEQVDEMLETESDPYVLFVGKEN